MSGNDRLGSRRDQMSAVKRALLEQWKKGEVRRQAKPAEGIPRRPEAASAPLSFAQQQLWFLDQLNPGNTAYNEPALLRLTGELERDALRRAFEELVERHEILRTAFETTEGEARQVIHPRVELPFEAIDLSDLADGEKEAAARRETMAAAWQSFDLGQAPLLRCFLMRLDPRQHWLLVVFHHIVSDVWSRGVLIQEVGRLYEAFRQGLPSPLAPPPIQYGDYAHWQRRWMSGAVLDRQLAHWTKELADPPPPLEMPTDRPRSEAVGARGARYRFRLPGKLKDAVKEYGRDRDATLFMTLLTAFHVLLGRYCGSWDFSIGTPIANRDRRELESLIGFFVNTLTLRIDGRGDLSYRDLLERVRRVALGAFTHRAMPFELLVEKLAPQRDLGDSPFFRLVFVLQNAPVARVELPALRIETLELEAVEAKFDLSFNIEEGTAGLAGFLEYNAGLFDRTTIIRLFDQYQRLLEEMVEEDGRRLFEVALESRAERHQLLVEWNSAPIPSLHPPAGPPQDIVEELRGIWCRVLALPRVGLEDSFFDLGGNSLLGLEIIDRARRAGLPFTSRELYERQTIAGVAHVIERNRTAAGGEMGLLQTVVESVMGARGTTRKLLEKR